MAAAATAALLVAVGVDGGGRRRDVDATAHHARVQEAVRTVPYSVGDWLARDVAVPEATVTLLKPDVLVSRRYENLRTGETASVLFVACGDARDLLGHYPPICYPAHGTALTAAAPRDWTVGSLVIRGVRYRFRGHGGSPSQFVVDNFMVLPSGGFGRDMDAVDRVARDPAWRRFGAAEVQIATDATMDDSRRDEVFRTLAASYAPLFRTFTAGDAVRGDVR
jgi:hypothetical protein